MADDTEDVSNEGETPEAPAADAKSWGDRMVAIHPHEPLKPRHRKLCELAARGVRNQEIAEKVGYSEAYVSIILSNSRIKEEIAEIQDRLHEDPVATRLKRMGELALMEIERCLKDNTKKYKTRDKIELAKWLIEKIDGKAVQTHDIGENLLGTVLDQIEYLKSTGRPILHANRTRNVTPEIEGQVAEPAPEPPKTEGDIIDAWVDDFEKVAK